METVDTKQLDDEIEGLNNLINEKENDIKYFKESLRLCEEVF